MKTLNETEVKLSNTKYRQPVPFNLSVPTLDNKGKVTGAHDVPMFLITTDGRTDTGSGVAYFFNQHDAEQVCREHNSHEALLEACKLVIQWDDRIAHWGKVPPIVRDVLVKAISEAEGRSA